MKKKELMKVEDELSNDKLAQIVRRCVIIENLSNGQHGISIRVVGSLIR